MKQYLKYEVILKCVIAAFGQLKKVSADFSAFLFCIHS
jgi:hypothetical protein